MGHHLARVTVAVLLTAGLAVVMPTDPAGADGNEAPGAPEAFRALSAGDGHTCALRQDGAVRCWGANFVGQLGLGDTAERGDQPDEMGPDLPTVDLGTGRTATAISAGTNHTCAVLDDGTAKCWGNNSFGELGLGDLDSRGAQTGEMGDDLPTIDLGTGRTATAITAGDRHTCAILDTGDVKCWGRNDPAQLGLGDVAHRGDGPGEMGDALPTVALGTGRTAIAITAGNFHTCALLDDDTVKCWGNNAFGQLGLGHTDARGDQTGEMGDDLPTIDLGTGRTVAAISAGGSYTCALLDDAAIKCWGTNGVGQLGLGDTDTRGDQAGEMGNDLPAVDLGPSQAATSVSVAAGHACAVLAGGSVKCWGWNDNGRLGLGDSPDHRGDGPDEMGDDLPAVALGTGRTTTAVTVGNSHACAVLDTEEIRCWGKNITGGLGLGDTDDRGDGPDEMGDALPTVDLPPANDDFASAQTVTGAPGTVAGSTIWASIQDPEEPDHNPAPANGAVGSIWYAWTAPANGRTSFDTIGTGFDTVLAVYTGTALDGLTLVGANDDTGGPQSRVTFSAAAGTTYRIALAASDTADPTSGRTTLNWRQSAPCDGRPVTRDLSMGDAPTNGADVIRGTNGNDTINGLAGADRICGGNGNDTLIGGPGTTVDRLFGENGNDTLRGGAGNDLLNGGNNNDRLFGDAGNDTLNGSTGLDNLQGGTGTDRLNGGPQRDTCNGGPQRDTHTGCEVRTSIP